MKKTLLIVAISFSMLFFPSDCLFGHATSSLVSIVGLTYNHDAMHWNRQICRDDLGNVHIIYVYDSNTVTYVKSIDEGRTWCPHNISTTTRPHSPAIAWSGVALFAFWRNYTVDAGAGEAKIEVWKSTDKGETWVQQTVPPIISNWEATYTAKGNSIYIAYMAAGWNTEIRFIRSSDGGLTWGPEKTIATPDKNSPKIAVDGVGDSNDKIYVAFSADPASYGLFFVSSLDGGVTWGCVKTLDSNFQHYFTDITFDSSNIYIVSAPTNGQRISFSNSSDYGNTWSFAENIDQRASSEDLTYGPKITVNSEYHPLVLYYQNEMGYWNIVYREWNGTGWKDEVKVTNDTLDNRSPNTKYFASYNRIELVWLRGFSIRPYVGPYEIVYSSISPPSIVATVDIAPDTLNLKSKGKWITAYIELPEDYDVNDIDISSILLNDTIPVDPSAPTSIGDYDSDGIPDLMVKLDRAAVISYINIQLWHVTLTITGELTDGTPFEGSDVIRVICPGSYRWV